MMHLLPIGLINDMYAENSNDDYKYAVSATCVSAKDVCSNGKEIVGSVQ